MLPRLTTQHNILTRGKSDFYENKQQLASVKKIRPGTGSINLLFFYFNFDTFQTQNKQLIRDHKWALPDSLNLSAICSDCSESDYHL